MKAVVHDRYGPPEVLRIEDVERPVPKENEEQAAMAAQQALRLGLLTRRQLEQEAARRGKTRALATLFPDR